MFDKVVTLKFKVLCYESFLVSKLQVSKFHRKEFENKKYTKKKFLKEEKHSLTHSYLCLSMKGDMFCLGMVLYVFLPGMVFLKMFLEYWVVLIRTDSLI